MAIILYDQIFDSDDEYLMTNTRCPRKRYERRDFFEELDEINFQKRFRLSKNAAWDVLAEIEPILEYPTDMNNAVSPINQLLLALRYFATGSFGLVIADNAGVSGSTANRIIHRVSKAICSLKNKYICFPTTDAEVRRAMVLNNNIARFPNVIGMIDCTHIRIRSPGNDNAELYRNRKGYMSLNVQVIGDANLEIVNLVARWPGSAHDSTIFSACHRKAMFEDGRHGEALLLGDSGYPLYRYLMTPLTDPITAGEKLYNESHIRTRNAVERLFGVWKRRFPVLALGFNLRLSNILPVITATAVLHNILRQRQEPLPVIDPALELPMSWNRLIALGQIQPAPHQAPNARYLREGERLRNNLVQNYFARL